MLSQAIQQFLGPMTMFHYDWETGLVTAIALPVVGVIVLLIRKFVSTVVRYVGEGFVFAASRVLFRRLSATLTLARYAKLALAGTSNVLHIPSSTSDVSLRLDDVFVPLSLEKALDQRLYDHTNLLEVGSRIRIIGDPGSGKSTIARRLFRDQCRLAASWKPSLFPIIIELKTIGIPKTIKQENLGMWLFNYVKKFTLSYDVFDMDKCFSAYVGSKGLLLILDGLDEVSTANYVRMRDAINLLSDALHKHSESNVVVMTLRSQFHQQIRDDYSGTFPNVLTLRRFSSTDIYKFLSNWPFTRNKSEHVLRIYNDLSDKPALRELCTNPLILSMYVARDQEAADLRLTTATRTSFYGSVTEELIIRRRISQTLNVENQDVLRAQRYRVLGAIAFNHLVVGRDSANYISWSEATKIVAAQTKKGAARAEDLLREISKDTGLITEERRGETLRFIHLTFCEFLSAHYAREYRADGWHDIVKSFWDCQKEPNLSTRLVEVLPFAIALLPKSRQPEAFSELKDCNNFYMLSLCYMEAKLYDSEWEAFRRRFEEYLLASAGTATEGDGSADWFRNIHIYLALVNDADRALTVLEEGEHHRYDVAEFFTRIASASLLKVSSLTMAYASQDANAAFRVATDCGIDVPEDMPEMITQYVDQPPFLDMLLQRASQEAERAPRLIALIAEAALSSEAVAAALYSRQPLGLRASGSSLCRWTQSKLIENTLLAECLDLGGSELKTDTDLRLVPLFMEIPVAYSGRVNRYEFVVAKHFGRLILGGYLLFIVLLEFEIFRAHFVFRMEQHFIFHVPFIDSLFIDPLIQSPLETIAPLIVVLLISGLSVAQLQYVIPRYYACLNLSDAVRPTGNPELKNLKQPSFAKKILLSLRHPWFLYNAENPERRVPVMVRPFVGMARINKIDEFIAYRRHARGAAE